MVARLPGGADDKCCRLLVGMHRPPEEAMRLLQGIRKTATPCDGPALARPRAVGMQQHGSERLAQGRFAPGRQGNFRDRPELPPGLEIGLRQALSLTAAFGSRPGEREALDEAMVHLVRARLENAPGAEALECGGVLPLGHAATRRAGQSAVGPAQSKAASCRRRRWLPFSTTKPACQRTVKNRRPPGACGACLLLQIVGPARPRRFGRRPQGAGGGAGR